MNKVYLIVSEELTDSSIANLDPPEHYNIFAAVVARSTPQAKYLVWTHKEKLASPDVRDMPRFYSELKLKNVPFEPQVLSDIDPAFDLQVDESCNDWLLTFKEDFLDYAYHQKIEEEA